MGSWFDYFEAAQPFILVLLKFLLVEQFFAYPLILILAVKVDTFSLSL
jgi:hypothetical protein